VKISSQGDWRRGDWLSVAAQIATIIAAIAAVIALVVRLG
jgi:hypothetical protein